MSSIDSTPAQAGPAEIAEALRSAGRVIIYTHLRPDGDCLGSGCGLQLALEAMGKDAVVYNPSGVPEKLAFIPGTDRIVGEQPAWTPDLHVFVDSSGVDRVAPGLRLHDAPVLNIDHHATNDQFGALNFVDTKASSVGEQMVAIVESLGVEFTRDIATCLCTAILTDTGGLRYSSVSDNTFQCVARMKRAGADPAEICQRVFESRRLGEIVLIGRVYSRLQLLCGGRLSTSEITQADYAEVGGEDMEPDGLSGDIRAIEGVEVAILFHEVEGGGLRAGLRGKGNVDCTRVASKFGGGGHFNASGCFIAQCDYEATKQAMIDAACEEIVAALGPA